MNGNISYFVGIFSYDYLPAANNSNLKPIRVGMGLDLVNFNYSY
jgi:hypothetical protein